MKRFITLLLVFLAIWQIIMVFGSKAVGNKKMLP